MKSGRKETAPPPPAPIGASSRRHVVERGVEKWWLVPAQLLGVRPLLLLGMESCAVRDSFFFFLFIQYPHCTYEITATILYSPFSISCLCSGGTSPAPLGPPPRPVSRKCESYQRNNQIRKEINPPPPPPIGLSCRRHEVEREEEKWWLVPSQLLGVRPLLLLGMESCAVRDSFFFLVYVFITRMRPMRSWRGLYFPFSVSCPCNVAARRMLPVTPAAACPKKI